MTREEVAAKALLGYTGECVCDVAYASRNLIDPECAYHIVPNDEAASDVLAASDAFDAANGVHRVAIDDATVERAAKAACPWVDWKTSADDVTPAIFQKIRLERNRSKSLVRAVLAAAVKEDQ